MANSISTKRALASALKKLMREHPFEKISVTDISEECGINRKSFYYHFQDKYDLVNWIFDTEFIMLSRDQCYTDQWDFMEHLCAYFYENRYFYRKALKIEGQNSFSEHFRERLQPVLKTRIEAIMNTTQIHPFYLDFYADAFYCAITRWLQSPECMPPQEFVSMLRSLIEGIAVFVCRDMSQSLDVSA